MFLSLSLFLVGFNSDKRINEALSALQRKATAVNRTLDGTTCPYLKLARFRSRQKITNITKRTSLMCHFIDDVD